MPPKLNNMATLTQTMRSSVSSADPKTKTEKNSLEQYAQQYKVTTYETMTFHHMGVLLYVIPASVIVYVLISYGPPSWAQALSALPCALLLIGGPMSVCLHRYFAHSAFKTSRAGQFVLSLIACLAYQKGPVWWASKHRRHHKLCDKPGDPHSPTVSGYGYGWVLWTMAEEEYLVDSDFVTKLESFPELMFVDRFFFVVPLLVNLGLLKAVGPMWTVCTYTFPMMLCAIITLLFNVEYHPKQKPGDTPCKAVDNQRFLSELVGESYHDDHHIYPGKAHRPGMDLPYWFIIKPAESLGLIWKLKKR